MMDSHFLDRHVKIKRGFCFHLLLNPLFMSGGGIHSVSDITTVLFCSEHTLVLRQQVGGGYLDLLSGENQTRTRFTISPLARRVR